MRRNLVLFITLFMLLISSNAFAQESITLKVNGKVIESDQPAQIINNRTMVPVRFVSEALGAKVDWDSESRTVLIATNDMSNNFVSLESLADKPGIKIVVDGRLIEVDQPPTIINNRVMIPVRFVSEALGADVNWDGKTRTVIINNSYSIKSVDVLLATSFKLVSYSPEESEWPYYLLAPTSWNETIDKDTHTKKYKTEDGLSVLVKSSLYETPQLLNPTRYSYYGSEWLTGQDSRHYEINHPILMGYLPGYHFSYKLDDGRVREKYIIMDQEGCFELDFDAEPKILEKYRDIIATMVGSFQTPQADGDSAWDRAVLALEYENFNLSANNMTRNLPALSQVDQGKVDAETALAQCKEYADWLAMQEIDPALNNLYLAEKTMVDNVIKYLEHKINGANEKELEEIKGEIIEASMNGVVERLTIHEQVFSGFQKEKEDYLGKFQQYSWDSGINVTDHSLNFTLLVPENWTVNRQENDLNISDPTEKYSYHFYIESGYESFFNTDNPDKALEQYNLVWDERLKDKEILYTNYGVLDATKGYYIFYEDTINGEDVIVGLFYTLGDNNDFYVIKSIVPVRAESDSVEKLLIMLESWEHDIISDKKN